MNDRGYKEKTSISIDPEILAKAREIAAKEQNSYTITATDLIAALPKAINKVL